MKLLKQVRNGWEYELNHQEAMCLRTLVREFPLTPATPAKITTAESARKAAERERLLNESMVEHRMDMKLKAARLLKASQAGWRLRLNPEERETLLQLLNDIRVGSWRALGEPEDLEFKSPSASERKLCFHTFMQLAGYFEVKLLNLEGKYKTIGVE